MSIRKRVIPVILCVMICLGVFSIPHAFAAGNALPDDPPAITPKMVYINNATYDFYIENGSAHMIAKVWGNSGATKCDVVIELQEKGLLFWNTVGTWSTSENGYIATLKSSKAVTSGKTYRMVAKVTVWCGSASESRTLTSSSIKA